VKIKVDKIYKMTYEILSNIKTRIEKMNETEGIIVSIILGLFLALCIRLIYNENNNIIIKSPPKTTVENKVFNVENKCYSLVAEESKCSS
jgi:hypothetical protein